MAYGTGGKAVIHIGNLCEGWMMFERWERVEQDDVDVGWLIMVDRIWWS